MGKRAIIYGRVSTDDQRNNYSIPSQVDECRKYIDTHGYTLVGNIYVDPETGQDSISGIPAFVDDYSSREMNRPGLDAAYEYLEDHGFDVVVVYSIDRLDRDPYKLRTHEYGFAKKGAVVEYVKGDYQDTPEGQFLKTVVASAAKLDNDWRIERFNRGKRQKARRGLFVAGRPPYGYRIDKSAPGGLVIEEEEAQVVRWIFDTYASRDYSLYDLIRALNENGALPMGGGEWQKSTVKNILTNTAYAGTAYYNKFERQESRLQLREKSEWIEIPVPATIDPGLFDEVQARLRQNKENKRKQPERDYLLSGLVVCEHCGRAYVAQTTRAGKHRRANDAPAYRHRKRQGHCTNKQISARVLEPLIWSKIEALLLDPQTLRDGYDQALEKERQAHRRQIELRDVIDKEITKKERMLAKLTQTYLDDDIGMTKAEYLEQRAGMLKDVETARARLEEVESILANIPTPEEYASLEKFSAEIRKRLTGPEWSPSLANKRRVLELLRVRVFVESDGSGRITGWLGADIGFTYRTSLRLARKTGYFSIPFIYAAVRGDVNNLRFRT